MDQSDAQSHILEEWFRLPESRRQHPTDAVAFAYRILREDPEVVEHELRWPHGDRHSLIVEWLMPHLTSRGTLCSVMVGTC
jgi:hypothetical protein